MAPATRRNAFCDLLHLIKMSLDDVLFNCIFHASLHSGGKGSRIVQNTWMVRKRGYYINLYHYKRIHRLSDSNINTFLMNTFIIFFLLTNVNLITALLIILHYISVVQLSSSVLLKTQVYIRRKISPASFQLNEQKTSCVPPKMNMLSYKYFLSFCFSNASTFTQNARHCVSWEGSFRSRTSHSIIIHLVRWMKVLYVCLSSLSEVIAVHCKHSMSVRLY